MSNKKIYIIALLLLTIMLITCILTLKDDSFTFDETAHVSAGYSYLAQRDYRMNPEHPPFIKDLAAFPLLFLNLNFPKNDSVWQEAVPAVWWHQFNFGNKFLYYSGNNPDQILFWSRIPMILITIFLGFFIFHWTRKLGGNKAAVLALIIFSFCPTFLAHGRLVTTDVAASLGVVIASYFWIKFLKNTEWKNMIIAGLIFGLVMMFKFSLILLAPFFAIITVVAAYLKFKDKGFKKLFLGIAKQGLLAIIIMLIGLIFVIWPVYTFHVSNYPIEKQVLDTKQVLESSSVPFVKNICVWMSQKSLLRPLAQYLLGLIMVTQRTVGGNTVYFMGMVSGTGWWFYFPIIYFLKIPLAFHILTFIALFWAVFLIKEPFWRKPFSRTIKWIEGHFTEFSMMVFLAIYWTTSIMGHLNIGVRHILPTFPFIYILVSLGVFGFTKKIKKQRKIAAALIGVLLIWYIGSSLSTWPFYISYFNEAAGGTDNGYVYAVDSNYDWGQDLKRLKKWVEEENIDKIYLDYFGGGDPNYYLEEKYFDWSGTNKPFDFPKGNYLAVSANSLQGGIGIPSSSYNSETGFYNWLNNYTPVARAGKSIFIYYIK